MIHRDLQNKLTGMVVKWINFYIDEREEKLKMKYGSFRRWMMGHLNFNGLNPGYDLEISISVDQKREIQKPIFTVSFPTCLPEGEYEVMSRVMAMKLLKHGTEIYTSDLGVVTP
jgi:hypothetical protein